MASSLATSSVHSGSNEITDRLPSRSDFYSILSRHFALCSDHPTYPAFRARTRFRGVTKHKRTQRFEAHIWNDKKQVYLGGFDSEIHAAMSHDIMAIRCKGLGSDILNFSVDNYADLIPIITRLSREDIITALRSYSKSQTAERGSAAHTRVRSSKPECRDYCYKPRNKWTCHRLSGRSDHHGWNKTIRLMPTSTSGNSIDGENSPKSPPSPLFPPSTHVVAPLEEAEHNSPRRVYPDEGDLENIWEIHRREKQVSAEETLCFSASDESYLFESMLMDDTHTALEHLSGAVLFQENLEESH